jgi:hypothetical protein
MNGGGDVAWLNTARSAYWVEIQPEFRIDSLSTIAAPWAGSR